VGRVADRAAGLTGTTDAAPTARRRAARRLLTALGVVVLLLVVGSITGLLPLQVMRVGSGSMTPTMAIGDLVVLERGAGPVGRQDVVVIPDPETGELLVKRVVGLGGDQIAIEDGVLVVDGRPVCEPLIDPSRQDGVWFGPVTVPAGEVFLLGDDRGSSIDSRDFGPVAADEVEGLVGFRVWPSPGPLPVDSC
jgi:signal peptidase I